MQHEIIKSEVGVIVEEGETISLFKICHYCSQPAEKILQMVEEGMIEPIDEKISCSRWQFSNDSLLRIQTALRLQRDLKVNLAGAVLAMELLDEIKQLRKWVAYLQR